MHCITGTDRPYADGYVKPSPANQRAVLETVAALRQAGHECVLFEVPQGTSSRPIHPPRPESHTARERHSRLDC